MRQRTAGSEVALIQGHPVLPATEVAGAAAVAADTFDCELVATIAGCDTHVAVHVLDRLAERDLIRPVAVPGTGWPAQPARTTS